MVNAALGPDHDLAKRLAQLEARVAALSTNVFASEMSFPATASVESVTITSTNLTQAWQALFPLRHPFVAWAIWINVAAGTTATIEVDAGPNSLQGMLVNSSFSWTISGGAGGFNAPYFAGFQNAVGGSALSPAMPLGGDPSQYGAAWGVTISASVDTGSVSVQSPMLYGRFTQ